MTAASELHIIVPGICGPLAETRSLERGSLQSESLESWRTIKNWVRVLSRARCEPSSSTVTDVIESLFKLSIEGDFPSAALTMLALNNFDETSNYMFADPVHLQADMDHALLTSCHDLSINDHESEMFCEKLNQHFNQDGFHFIKINKHQWVISSKENIQLDTTPLVDAVGRNVNFILPQGDRSGYWKQKLTEAQMLLHSHEVNESRENEGKQSINSLWLHGSGKLPGFDRCNIDSVCSDDSLFKGLASHVQCDYRPLFDSATDYMNYLSSDSAGNHDGSRNRVNVLHLQDLGHLVNYMDVSIWSAKLEEILSSWIYPLLKMAHKNDIKATLYPCSSKLYKFSRYDAFKFWRQEKLSNHIGCY